MRIGKDGRIRVEVPVRFVNETLSPGFKRGGVLNIVRHDVEVICPYDHIPAFFEVDLTGLEIGRSIHISAVQLPKDAELDDQGSGLHHRHHRRRREAGRGSSDGCCGSACGRCGGCRRRRRQGRRGSRQGWCGCPPRAALPHAAPAAKGAAPAAKAAAPAAKKK